MTNHKVKSSQDEDASNAPSSVPLMSKRPKASVSVSVSSPKVCVEESSASRAVHSNLEPKTSHHDDEEGGTLHSTNTSSTMRSSRALSERAPIAVGQQHQHHHQQQQQDNPQQCQETSLASLSGEESDKNDNVNDNDDQQQPKHEPHNAMNGPDSGDMDSIMELEPQDYLPSYLRKLVQHHHGDFFYSPYFEERLIAQLMCEGFLPIATNRYLLPKLHKERSVIYPLALEHTPPPSSSQQSHHYQQQQQQSQSRNNSHSHSSQTTTCQVHTSRSTRKKAKRYTMSINQAFHSVITGCHNQHGISWLFPPIVQAFEAMHNRTTGVWGTTTTNNNNSNHNNSNSNSNHNNSSNKEGCVANLWDENGDACPVRLYSIEVWNKETGDLAAGELGYGVGKIYTSLTGFSQEDSAGSIQLAALGQLLYNSGYDMWDLGMALDYKSKLGAHGMKRGVFVETVKRLRMKKPNRLLECDEPTSCKELIGMETRI